MTTVTTNNRTERYSALPNKLVSAASGIDYAYRDTGGGRVRRRWCCCSTSAGTWTTGTRR